MLILDYYNEHTEFSLAVLLNNRSEFSDRAT